MAQISCGVGRSDFGALAALVGGGLLADDVVAQLDALVADEHRRAGDELAHLVLALAAERAVKQLLAGGGLLRHLGRAPWSSGPCPRGRTLPRLRPTGNCRGRCPWRWSPPSARCAWPGSRSAGRAGRGSRVAWISTSEACPEKPPIGWWIMTRELGRHEALVLLARRQQQRAHARRLADAQRRRRRA